MIVKMVQTNEISKRIFRIFAKSFEKEPWNEEWAEWMAEERLKSFLENPLSIAFIAEDEGKEVGILVGNFVYALGKKRFFIQEFAISTKVQGKGYGTRMLELVEKELNQREVTNLTLLTHESDITKKFYEKSGYFQVESMIIMEKKIGE